MSNKKALQGHMLRTKRIIAEGLSFCDMVVEIIDARSPEASRNKKIYQLTKVKPRIIIFNKADLAEEVENQKWLEYYRKKNLANWIIPTNLKSIAREKLLQELNQLTKLAMKSKKWYGKRAIRLLVLGMPNVGKSTFINKLIGKKKISVGNTPGVTKAEQVIKINNFLNLIDTPGLVEKLSEKDFFFLTIVGSIKNKTYGQENLAEKLIDYLKNFDEEFLKEFLSLPQDTSLSEKNILLLYAKKRNFIKKGEWDITRSAEDFLGQFYRGNKFSLTLEKFSKRKLVDNYFQKK